MTWTSDPIEQVECFDVQVPHAAPLQIGSAVISSRSYTLVRVRCASGVEGVGYTFSRGLPVAKLAANLFPQVLVGADATLPEQRRADVLRAYWPANDHGTFTAAVSAVDLALWDATGHRLGSSIAGLLGQARREVPACIVLGYAYDDNDATLRRQLEQAMAYRPRGLKLIVGGASPERDAQRVGLARSIAGLDMLLAVDAFRSFTGLDDAMRRVRLLEPYDLSFVEDPFSELLAPLAVQLRNQTGALIGLGESLAGHRSIARLVDSTAVDVVRLDALVIGGIREFMAAAGVASAAGLPVVTHVHPEVHIQLAAVLTNLYPGGAGVHADRVRSGRCASAAQRTTAGQGRHGAGARRPRPGDLLGLGCRQEVGPVSESPLSWGKPDPLSAFASPWDAPHYPAFPVGFRNVSILTVFWRTRPEAVERVLPPPLRPTAPVVAAQIYLMPDVDGMGRVNECNMMVAAGIGEPATVSGGFSTLLILDSDAGVAHGREVHGQPKKLGRPSVTVDGDLVVGRVARNGIDVLTATTPYKRQRSDLQTMRSYFDISENLNYKVVPNIDGTAACRQITARRLRDVEVHECWVGPATVELRPNAQAPIWELEVLEPLAAFYWRADFTLEPGRVVHDYLNESAKESL